MPARRPLLLLAINTAWNVVNFRRGLVTGLTDAGYSVLVAAPADRFVPEIEALGCRFVDTPLHGHGRSPLADLGYLRRMYALLRTERPTALLGYTVKPNIWGSLAAHSLGIPVINNVAGLGAVFNETGLTAQIVRRLYRVALRRSHRVFFQNRADQTLFIEERLAPAKTSRLLPGSGVDLARFTPQPPVAHDGPVRFLMVARLLREKGVAELAKASRILRGRGVPAQVQLLGPLDPANPAAVSSDELRAWVAEGVLEHWGAVDDIRPLLALADCVVLPSYYREGTPRALLEAAASAKPIITTDMPGCRDVVDPGVNGFTVPPRDALALADAMQAFTALGPGDRARMGKAGRVKAERQFDEAIVVRAYLDALAELGLG